MYETYTELSSYFKASGMPKSMASVLAYLTTCQPEVQSATDIEKALRLSKGSVNMALNSLVKARLVQSKITSEQGRYLEYKLDELGWERAIAYRLQSLEAAIKIASNGLLTNPDNMRLSAMRDAYAQFYTQFCIILDKTGAGNEA